MTDLSVINNPLSINESCSRVEQQNALSLFLDRQQSFLFQHFNVK